MHAGPAPQGHTDNVGEHDLTERAVTDHLAGRGLHPQVMSSAGAPVQHSTRSGPAPSSRRTRAGRPSHLDTASAAIGEAVVAGKKVKAG